MTSDHKYQRLSDRILTALELAILQKDLEISEALRDTLELAMTRNAGGSGFVEKRDYPPEIEHVMEKLRELQKSR